MSELTPAELLVSDSIGRLMEFWGFKRNMGRVWGVLHLSPDPLTSRDLQERLKLSSGSVSMTLAELGRWGVVRKVWVQGSRSEHHEAEGNLWKMVSRVLRERELTEVKEAVAAFEIALAKLDAADAPEARARLEHQRARIGELLELARLGRSLLEGLVSTARVDASALAKVLLGDSSKS